MMHRFVTAGKRFRKAIVSLVVIFQGVAIQSFEAEDGKYPLWQESASRETALYMKDMASEFQGLSDYWRVELSADFGKNVYEITGFPGQNRPDGSHREYGAYRPFFPEDFKIDSLILTRSDEADFLDTFWTLQGFSSHVILAQDGTAFIHANPLRREKGQMAGKWNARSFEVAFIDQGDQILSVPQKTALKGLLGIFGEKSPNINVVKGGSIYEAKQLDNISGFESGHVHNIDEVREFLGLSPLTLE